MVKSVNREMQRDLNSECVSQQIGHYRQSLKLYQRVPENVSRVLDAGCGSGFFTKWLGDKFETVIGVELIEEFSKKARNRYQVDVRTMALDKTSFSDGYFCCITADNVIEHVEDPVATLLEFNRILNIKGRALIAMPMDKRNPSWITLAHLWKTELAEVLKCFSMAGFAVLEHESVNVLEQFQFNYMPSNHTTEYFVLEKELERKINDLTSDERRFALELNNQCRENIDVGADVREKKAGSKYCEGIMLMHKNMVTDASERFSQALEINPYYKDAKFQLGQCYEKMGDRKRAIESYEFLLQNLNGDHASGRIALINCLCSESRLDEAKNHLYELRFRNPDVSFTLEI